MRSSIAASPGDDDHNYLSEVLTKLVTGTKIKPFESPPHGNAISRAKARTTSKQHTVVTDDSSLAHKASRREDQLLIDNFTRFNCGSCRIMEGYVFANESVSKLMRNYVVEARIHVDVRRTLTPEQFAAYCKLQGDLANTKITPFCVAVDPTTGKKVGTFALKGAFKQ
ncbi:MAG: hypothetical protein ACI89X_000578 [Planctomycetota bacterium]